MTSSYRQDLIYGNEDDESSIVKFWFDKNNLLIRGVYNHFAGSLSKNVDRQAVRISIAELLKFTKSIKNEEVLGLTAVK